MTTITQDENGIYVISLDSDIRNEPVTDAKIDIKGVSVSCKSSTSKVSISLQESPSWNYQDRTVTNAKAADITIAFAVDFTTAGERLTMREAGLWSKWVGIHTSALFGMGLPSKGVPMIRKAIYEKGVKKIRLNIAGNGIYTFAKKNIDQDEINVYIRDTLLILQRQLKEIDPEYEIVSIRSGGQTGADHGGLVAGLSLGIPVIGLYPKGFRRRNVDGEDYSTSEQNLLEEIITDASKLNVNFLTPMSAMLLGITDGSLVNHAETPPDVIVF